MSGTCLILSVNIKMPHPIKHGIYKFSELINSVNLFKV